MTKILSWKGSYMSDSDRKQFVQIHGDKSHTCSIMSGVPQGSILVPTLLSLYVNDFPDFITPGELYMFTDDTTIFTEGDNIFLYNNQDHQSHTRPSLHQVQC